MQTLSELLLLFKSGNISFSELMNQAQHYDAMFSNVQTLGYLGAEIKPSRDFQRSYRKVLDALYRNILSIEAGETGTPYVLSPESQENIDKIGKEFGLRPTWMEA